MKTFRIWARMQCDVRGRFKVKAETMADAREQVELLFASEFFGADPLPYDMKKIAGISEDKVEVSVQSTQGVDK
jgi:hypothetical protein